MNKMFRKHEGLTPNKTYKNMNPYIKQFPDLMSGKKIMYVHGFLSSGQSGTVKMLQELMPNATLVAEDIPVHPEEGMEMLQKMAGDREARPHHRYLDGRYVHRTAERYRPHPRKPCLRDGQYNEQHDRQAGIPEPEKGRSERTDGYQGTHQGIP